MPVSCVLENECVFLCLQVQFRNCICRRCFIVFEFVIQSSAAYQCFGQLQTAYTNNQIISFTKLVPILMLHSHMSLMCLADR
jgi:hypothetical protein